jgi:hypothetical protein
MQTNTELYSYTFDKEDPYTFNNKYRLVGINSLSISTTLDINTLIVASNKFSELKIEGLECTLTIIRSNEDISVVDFSLDIEIYEGDFKLSVEDGSLEDYLSVYDYVETSKY